MYGSWIKRALDVVLASFVLVLLSPLIVIICCLILLSSNGPVLFTQLRVGLDGKNFKIFKFRTLTSKTRDETIPTDESSVEISSLGKFLRRHKLDEIPQLVNVLLGDMSLIGPRPYVYSMVFDLEEEFGELAILRKSVRPGLTGLAQVCGNRNLSTWQRLRYDAQYVQKILFFSDLRIFLRTAVVVILGDSVAVISTPPIKNCSYQESLWDSYSNPTHPSLRSKPQVSVVAKEIKTISAIEDSVQD